MNDRKQLRIFSVSLLIAALALLLGLPAQAAVPAQNGSTGVFINEIHYDNAGADEGEAIEVAGPAGTDLAGWSLVLYNGSNGAVYDTTALSGVVPDQQNGFGTLYFTYPTNGIQNGSPDGVALVDAAGSVVQFLSYEGTLTAVDGPANGMTSTDIGVAEDSGTAVGDSLQLAGEGAVYEDFTWNSAAPNTFGSVNTGQTFTTGPGPTPTPTPTPIPGPMADLVINEIDYDQPGTDSAEFLEIKNVTDGTINLDPYAIELVNGSGGGAAVYNTIELPAIDLAAGDYYVICGDAATVANCDLDAFPDTNLIQNGAPDAVALVLAGEIVDTVSYEGDTVAPYTEGSGAGLEDPSGGVNVGISRFPDGTDTNQNNADLSLRCITPGEANTAESTNCARRVSIFDIQFTTDPSGDSPYAGQAVKTQGVVTAFFGRDVFIQDGPGPWTGLKLFRPSGSMAVGDLVEVTGEVSEFFGMTEIASGNVTVLSSGNPLPEPEDLNPPFDNDAARAYLESFEAVYVKLDDVAVVGPTNRFDETWVVRSDLGLGRVFQDDPAGTGEVVGVDDSGRFEITPEAKVGDQVLGLLGPLDFTFEAFKMQLTAAPTLVAAPDPPKRGDADGDGDIDGDDLAVIQAHLNEDVPPGPPGADLTGDGRITGRDVVAFVRLFNDLRLKKTEFTVGTFNLENLFDTVDEPDKDDPITDPAEYELKLDKLAEAIHDDLREPMLLGVQEAENLTVLTDLAARPELEAGYGAILVDGPDGRGIDVGLLYQTDQVTVLNFEQRQGCTTLLDGLGPDGNRDVENPQNAITCDSDGDGELDGNRLFSRPPLVVQLAVRPDGLEPGQGPAMNLWVIVNHFKSKSEDTATVEYTLPRRVEQAAFVAGLADEILAADPEADLIVLGDLNDFLDSEPLATLTGAGLSNLLFEAPKPERYSFIFQGVSEVLDHVLISADLWSEFERVAPLHINADFPNAFVDVPDIARGSSDHDPVLVRFRFGR